MLYNGVISIVMSMVVIYYIVYLVRYIYHKPWNSATSKAAFSAIDWGPHPVLLKGGSIEAL